MAVRSLLLLVLLGFASTAQAVVEIWNWGFVTRNGEDFLANDGTSLFEVRDATRSGPLNEHAKGRPSMNLSFTIDGSHVHGTLSADEVRGEKIQLEGEIVRKKVGGKFPCLETIRMSNEIHYVVLERSPQSCN